MSPRVVPKTPAQRAVRSILQRSEASSRHIQAEADLSDAKFTVGETERELRAADERQKRDYLQAFARSPYGPGSEHSWLLDSGQAAGKGAAPPDVTERLNQSRAAMEREIRPAAAQETYAVGSSTLGGLIPATIEPWVAEAVAYGVRSTAPLAAALLRLDLPPVGMSAAWAKVTTAATVTNQTAENTAVTASTDAVIGSATDPLGTIAASLDFSAQSLERSGGWFDRVAGEEMGRAFGARLEQQIWAGTGANGQFKGLTVMTGNSSSTVSGQTFPLTVNKIADQFQQVTTNLGEQPDILAIAPRRYSALEMGTGALGLEVNSIVPQGIELVISPAAPLTLGGGTEDWLVLLNRAACPLVADDAPQIEFQNQGPSAGINLGFRWLVYAYAALGVSRRPEGVGIIKGLTPPTFT
jgi:HK97 family phage major capsid protein